jgi:hypothetical protein
MELFATSYRWSPIMFTTSKLALGALITLYMAIAMQPRSAQAVTAEVAKKCDALLARQFPPREPGNPAAGSSKGSSEAQRDYFKKCIENGGNMDSATDKK